MHCWLNLENEIVKKHPIATIRPALWWIYASMVKIQFQEIENLQVYLAVIYLKPPDSFSYLTKFFEWITCRNHLKMPL